jgi:hypothetical protein
MVKLGRFGWGQSREFTARSDRGLYGDLPAGSDIAGAADKIGRQRLAEQLSGTTDRKSRKYRNARDYISRHVRGARRTVKSEFEGKVAGLLRNDRRAEIRQRGSMRVEIRADVQVSKKVWKGLMRKDLTGSQVNDYLDALERDDGNEAMSVFLDAYGIGRDVSEVKTVRDVSYTW